MNEEKKKDQSKQKSKKLPSAFPGPGKSQKNTWTCMACGLLNIYPDHACAKCNVPEGFKMKKKINWGTNTNLFSQDDQDVEGSVFGNYDYRLQVDLPTFGGLDLNPLAAQGDTLDENTFYHASVEEKQPADDTDETSNLDRALDKAFGDGWLSDDEGFLGEKFMGDGWLSDKDDDASDQEEQSAIRRDSGVGVASLF